MLYFLNFLNFGQFGQIYNILTTNFNFNFFVELFLKHLQLCTQLKAADCQNNLWGLTCETMIRKRAQSFYEKEKTPDWYFKQWLDAEYLRLLSETSPQSSKKNISPTTTSALSSLSSLSSLSPTSPSSAQKGPLIPSSKARKGVNVAVARRFFVQSGLTETPQQRIANDVLVLEVMKDNNTRFLSRELLEIVVLKIGKKLYHSESLTREKHIVKRMLVQNHAGIEYQPPPSKDVIPKETIKEYEEYQSALHEMYEYELSFKKIFTYYQYAKEGDTAEKDNSYNHHDSYQRHAHRHHHHFAKMNEDQYIAFYHSISLIPNLVEKETCQEAFHSQHTNELGFENFIGSMARLAIAAFSNTGKKRRDWLENKSGSQKVDMLVQFMNRRIGKMQEQNTRNNNSDGISMHQDLRLLKDHTLEHQHNRMVLNLSPSLAETLGKDQIVQGYMWLGMSSSSDESNSSSSSSSESEVENERDNEDVPIAKGSGESEVNRDERGKKTATKEERRQRKLLFKEKERKAKLIKLNKRKQIVKETMNPTTKNLILNLMKCVKNMKRDMTRMRQERMMSLILHRWHTFVFHSKFRRMTQQGKAEHQASALASLSHCADEWKRRVMANALHVWYRWSQHTEAVKNLASRAIRTRVSQLYETCFFGWRNLVATVREEKKILRNFVMRWNNLELHRWFNMWHRKVKHVVRIKLIIYRKLHEFKFRCFNYWQQYAGELQHSREIANAKGKESIFNRLHTCISRWKKFVHDNIVERDYVYIMTMRRHHRFMQHVFIIWLNRTLYKDDQTNADFLSYNRKRSQWDDMFDEINGVKEMDPIQRAIMTFTNRNIKRLKRKYFNRIKQSADENSIKSNATVQFGKIHRVLLRIWRLKELRYIFNGWVHVTGKLKQLRIQIENLVQRIDTRLLQGTFAHWKEDIKQESYNKHVLHKFVLRLKYGSVSKTFNTWKEETQTAVSNRYKLRKFVMYFNNKTVVHCMRAWKNYAKDKIMLRTNLEGIDRYVLLERSVVAWRFLTKRRKLHQRTGSLVLSHTKHKNLRKHFVEWSRIVGNIAYTGNRRTLLLDSMRRWSNSVACLKAAKLSSRRDALQKIAWSKEVVAPYEERIRRLEFQLAQVDQSKQSDSKEKEMLHAYLSHSAQRNLFALDVIKQLRRKLT